MQHGYKIFSTNFKNAFRIAPYFFLIVEGHFLYPKMLLLKCRQQIKKQGGMTITNLLCNGFNHRIHQTADGMTHATPTQGEPLKIKSVLAEQGKISLAETPLFTKTLGGTTYTVYVHNSQTSRDNFEDKILRLLESEVV